MPFMHTRWRRQQQPYFVLALPLLRRIIGELFVMGGTIAQSSVGCQVSLSGRRPSVTQFH
jgi:hypothetical protein